YVEGPNLAAGSMFVQLTDMPADFTSATAVTVKARHEDNTSGNDTITAYYQLFSSDETTALTAETTGTVLTPNSYTTDTNAAAVTGANDRASWDGARLRLRQAYAKSGGTDTTAKARVTAVEVDI